MRVAVQTKSEVTMIPDLGVYHNLCVNVIWDEWEGKRGREFLSRYPEIG